MPTAACALSGEAAVVGGGVGGSEWPVVVIDALNVARFHAHDTHHAVGSARRVAAAIAHFTATHEVHAILPEWAMRGRRRLSEAELLEPLLHRQLHLSPAGSNDDEFVLRFALRRKAKVLTNDLLRDHIESGLVTREWASSCRVAFMFIGDDIVVGGE